MLLLMLQMMRRSGRRCLAHPPARFALAGTAGVADTGWAGSIHGARRAQVEHPRRRRRRSLLRRRRVASSGVWRRRLQMLLMIVMRRGGGARDRGAGGARRRGGCL